MESAAATGKITKVSKLIANLYYKLPLPEETLWSMHHSVRQRREEFRSLTGRTPDQEQVQVAASLFETLPVLLSGYYKSGNTWLRLLIFNYLRKHLHGLDGPILVKELNELQPVRIPWPTSRLGQRDELYPFLRTHKPLNRHYLLFDKRIYIVRNPLDCLVSNYHWFVTDRRDQQHLRNMALAGEEGKMREIDYFVKRMLGYWIFHVRLGIRYSNFVLTYEALKSDPVKSLIGLLSFMDHSIDKSSVEKAVEWSDFSEMKKLSGRKGDTRGMGSESYKGDFFRKGKIGSYVEELEPDTIDFVVKQVRGTFKNHPSLLKSMPDICADPDH